MVELLSPAGDKESFLAAINNGANAIYLGLNNFSARNNIANFDFESLSYLIKYAKLFDVKVYVALNTLVKDDEINDFFAMANMAYELNVDAFIIQDIFLGKTLKKLFPNIVLHLSTQAGVSNAAAVSLAKEYGFSRIILARETPIKEIAEISKEIETEVFIQGALCTSYSGHCYFSGIVGGNSANRGLCKQPCRMKYVYKNKDISLTENAYVLSLADLSVREKIDELIKAGVTSFKIEGRMRRAEYVAEATNFYRELIDEKLCNNSLNSNQNDNTTTIQLNKKDISTTSFLNKNLNANFSKLKRVFNRGGYTYGLAFNQDKNFISYKTQGHIGEELGEVKKILPNNFAEIKLRMNYLGRTGDAYKILRNDYEVGNGVFKNSLNNETFIISYNGDIKINDIINITTDTALKESLLKNKKLLPVKLNLVLEEGETLKINISYKNQNFKYESDFILESAKSSPLVEKEVLTAFNKTAEYPFMVELTTKITGNIFINKASLNQVRREVFNKIFSGSSTTKNNILPYNATKTTVMSNINDIKIAIISQSFSFNIPKNVDAIILAPKDYNCDEEFIKFKNETLGYTAKTFLFVPAFLTSVDIDIIKKKLIYFDGIYADSYQAFSLAISLKVEVFSGLGMNIFNQIDTSELNGKKVLSKELNLNEIKSFDNDNYYFAVGNISLMDLCYCPFGKNCSTCKINGAITLTDSENRKFFVRRYKLSTCRFEVYNAFDLVYPKKINKNMLLNFVNYDNNTIKTILENIDSIENLKKIITNHTSGSLIKGIK